MKFFQPTALKFVGAASATLLLVMALTGCGKVKDALQSPAAPTPAIVRLSDARQGLLYQQQGVMAKQDYLHLVQIQDGINQTQAISEGDVNFLVGQLNSRPIQTA